MLNISLRKEQENMPYLIIRYDNKSFRNMPKKSEESRKMKPNKSKNKKLAEIKIDIFHNENSQLDYNFRLKEFNLDPNNKKDDVKSAFTISKGKNKIDTRSLNIFEDNLRYDKISLDCVECTSNAKGMEIGKPQNPKRRNEKTFFKKKKMLKMTKIYLKICQKMTKIAKNK